MFNSNHAFLLVQKLKSALSAKLCTLGVKAKKEMIFSICCPKLLINVELYGLVLAPRLKKRIPSNLGSQFATLVANVVAFINKLGPDKKAKNAQNCPKFFQP
jgi:hypothetical protein